MLCKIRLIYSISCHAVAMFPIFGTANGANRGSLLDETGILSCLAMIAPPEYKVCNSPGWKTRARLNGAGVPSGRMQSVVVERAGGRKKTHSGRSVFLLQIQ